MTISIHRGIVAMYPSRLYSAAAGLALAVATTAVHAEIKGETFEYSVDGTPLQGYIAYDDSIDSKRPGVLVVHEWWGHNDYVRRRADMLAELGYTALALDMYGDGKLASHPEDANKFMQESMSNMDAMVARFEAAMAQLKEHPTVTDDDLAAIGYCFGGAVVLNMARSSVELDGVASFHGALQSPIEPQPGDIKASVLVLHGGADAFVPSDQVAAFNQQMIDVGADYTFVSYPDVQHSFTSEEADAKAAEFDLPLAYDADADRRSWEEMQRFFDRVFAD